MVQLWTSGVELTGRDGWLESGRDAERMVALSHKYGLIFLCEATEVRVVELTAKKHGKMKN